MLVKFYYSDSNEQGSAFYEAGENTAFEINHDVWICATCLKEDDRVTDIAEDISSADFPSWCCSRCNKKMQGYENVNLGRVYYHDPDRNVGDDIPR